MAKGLLDAVRPGDRVTIVDRFGKTRTGRATIVVPGSHVVLNMGGAHGTPAVANDSNIVHVSKGKGKGGGFVFRNPVRVTKAAKRQARAMTKRYGKPRARKIVGAEIGMAKRAGRTKQKQHFERVGKALKKNPLPMFPLYVKKRAAAPWQMIAVARTKQAAVSIAHALRAAHSGLWVRVTDGEAPRS